MRPPERATNRTDGNVRTGLGPSIYFVLPRIGGSFGTGRRKIGVVPGEQEFKAFSGSHLDHYLRVAAHASFHAVAVLTAVLLILRVDLVISPLEGQV